MTTTPAFIDFIEPIDRDHYGRPMIKQLTGPHPVLPYTRTSTFAKSVSDTTGLMKWQKRQVVTGLAMNPALLNPLLTLRRQPEYANGFTNNQLDAVITEAEEQAGAYSKARIGTAIHGLTEWVDMGVEPDWSIPDFAELKWAVDSYRELTAGIEMVSIEQFVVHDEMRIAGTYDRACRLNIPGVGRCTIIGDLKTSSQAARDIQHEAGMQMAIYARSKRYDVETGERTPIADDLNPDYGLLIHLPSDGSKAGVYLLDLKAAWDAALLADAVRRWRTSKILTKMSDINHAPATTKEQ